MATSTPRAIRPIRVKRRSPADITDGAAVRELRYRRGLEIADLVRILAESGHPVHPDTVRNIEAGRRNASPTLTKLLADVLDVDPTYIMQRRHYRNRR